MDPLQLHISSVQNHVQDAARSMSEAVPFTTHQRISTTTDGSKRAHVVVYSTNPDSPSITGMSGPVLGNTNTTMATSTTESATPSFQLPQHVPFEATSPAPATVQPQTVPLPTIGQTGQAEGAAVATQPMHLQHSNHYAPSVPLPTIGLKEGKIT